MSTITKVSDSTLISEINKLRASGCKERDIIKKLAAKLPLKVRTLQERVKSLKASGKMKQVGKTVTVATKVVKVAEKVQKKRSPSTIMLILNLLTETLATTVGQLKATNQLANELLKELKGDAEKNKAVTNLQNDKAAQLDKYFRKLLNDTIESYGAYIHPKQDGIYPAATGGAIQDLKHRTKDFLKVDAWDEITAHGAFNAMEWLNGETRGRYVKFNLVALEMTTMLNEVKTTGGVKLAFETVQTQDSPAPVLENGNG